MITYALAVFVLALAWLRMLRVDAGRAEPLALMASYLVGQFAKYLPGNIFQYAARHGMGAAAGASHQGLVGAAFAEIYLLLCCGGALAIATGTVALADAVPAWPSLPKWLGAFPLIAAFAVSLPGRLAPRLRWLPRMPTATVAAVCACYLTFFLMFGVLYVFSLTWVTGSPPDLVAVVGSAAAAWVVGFIIPGPPAGAGVREAALTIGAGHSPQEAAVAASIVLFRLITLGGDFVAFIAGSLIGSRYRVSRPDNKREDAGR
ncbi:hypothetical protein QFW77_08270 [Luteimonas sp. RD2P54]|uniref:Flippase-like domain-containing protein n=1 Tax=Luteimonas endophytica TaxID=3042023 RepID=A0ABT6J9W2_9GAMM|nr:hypothetical protein [Luteimonas endophytica]MDH5822983.1 hypothetical protein [Luteimonas endophytica]